MITNARPSENSVVYRQENGVETIVDTDVAEWLPSVRLLGYVNGTYIAFRIGRTVHYLHRYIMKCPKGLVVDHMNGNTVDNRRENLRVCSVADNIRSRVTLNRNNSSGKRGVFYCKERELWVARIKHKRKSVWIGRFATFDEAKSARERAEVELWGEFKGKV